MSRFLYLVPSPLPAKEVTNPAVSVRLETTSSIGAGSVGLRPEVSSVGHLPAMVRRPLSDFNRADRVFPNCCRTGNAFWNQNRNAFGPVARFGVNTGFETTVAVGTDVNQRSVTVVSDTSFCVCVLHIPEQHHKTVVPSSPIEIPVRIVRRTAQMRPKPDYRDHHFPLQRENGKLADARVRITPPNRKTPPCIFSIPGILEFVPGNLRKLLQRDRLR